MDLQYTLEQYALQLKNVPRTLVEKIMKTLYDIHFPEAENHRPGPMLPRQRHSHSRVAT